jgi:hypothetical protein
LIATINFGTNFLFIKNIIPVILLLRLFLLPEVIHKLLHTHPAPFQS